MILGRRSCLAFVLLCSALNGCRHKAPPPPPAAAVPPPPSPTASSITVITPLPSLPPKAKSNVPLAPPEKPAPVPVSEPPKRPHIFRKKPAPAPPSPTPTPAPSSTDAVAVSGPAPPAAAPAAASTQPAPPAAQNSGQMPSTAAQQAAPALGELSTGTAISGSDRGRILGEIQAQEGRLGKLREPSSGDAQTTQMQIRTFLAKARQAVAENDLDGAQTLNTKARVLLDELQNE